MRLRRSKASEVWTREYVLVTGRAVHAALWNHACPPPPPSDFGPRSSLGAVFVGEELSESEWNDLQPLIAADPIFQGMQKLAELWKAERSDP